MSLLRFFMLLALVVWMGGLIFFSFVLAPTAFGVLPTRHLAGTVVGRSLGSLHWMGLVSGVVFLVASLLHNKWSSGVVRPFAILNLLILLMLVLTMVSQFGISPRMATLRTSFGDIDTVAPDNPARVQFNALHQWSTRVEIGVFLLGLVAIYMTARQFSPG